MSYPLTRRQWLRAFGLAAGALPLACRTEMKEAASGFDWAGQSVYFGDIHNHNAVGYAWGSLERSYDIAASHLDFFAFTPHSWWPDVPQMEQGKEKKWLDGFEVTTERWPDVQRLNESYHKDGSFVVLHAYEWHSSAHGDLCIYFPDGESELRHFESPEAIKGFAREHGAFLVPHHPAYRRGHRGADPSIWDPSLIHLLEIYSEHGNAEWDEGPFDYIRHSMGGRWTPNTLRSLLASGFRLGVLASSDDHQGYPGAYGEGLAAVIAPELTRESVFTAFRERRCYAVTGDRIRLGFSLNGAPMGSELAWSPERRIAVSVEGRDEIAQVEVLKNGRVIHRDFPQDTPEGLDVWKQPLLLRLEFGWGPWADLGIPRVADWRITVGLDSGRILGWQPCFQSGPPDENRRNRVSRLGPERIEVESYTSRLKAFAERPTNAVVLSLEAGPESVLRCELDSPAAMTVEKKLSELLVSNEVAFTGPFPDESLILHRLVPSVRYRSEFSLEDSGEGTVEDYYYVRVLQTNGQMAWSSPVWIARKT